VPTLHPRATSSANSLGELMAVSISILSGRFDVTKLWHAPLLDGGIAMSLSMYPASTEVVSDSLWPRPCPRRALARTHYKDEKKRQCSAFLAIRSSVETKTYSRRQAAS
jgi:hypothetical protein